MREDELASTTVDFKDTEIAFADKSDGELKKMAWLFRLMNNKTLVDVGSALTLFAVRAHLPLVPKLIEKTVFKQFCGGKSLLDSQKTIDQLYRRNCLTILDFGAEGKDSEKDFRKVAEETARAIDFAASNSSVPAVSTKLSGMARNALLKKAQSDNSLTVKEERELQTLHDRLDGLCSRARDRGVALMVDAEESWIQNTLDELVVKMMEKYNGRNAVVYNTYQLYRKDMYDNLRRDFERAREKGYLLGAKLVRGAYLDKERERAKENGYPSPVHDTKEATDRDYDKAVLFCVDHYEQIASCNASHNLESNRLLARLIDERNIRRSHPHLNFSQLYGMSDFITFNLADAGYSVAKYVPYGPIREIMPYLIRRAQENSSVTGDMSREYSLIRKELDRRGL